jgi:peptide/nickel transport system ATP-binding protein
MTALIETRNLSVHAARPLVDGISLTVEAGRPFTILGETGSGKSLLAQAIMGTLPEGLSASGEVAVGGRLSAADDIAHRVSLWGDGISMLPQEPWLSLDPLRRSVQQVADVHERVGGRSRRDARDRSETEIAALGLEGAGAKLPGQLSGGMAQRVAFAAARAGGASIVIADEPTKGLDAARRDDVAALLGRLREEKGGLLTITHDVAVARMLGGDVAIMRDAAFVERGPAERVLTAPESDYGKAFLAADPAAWPREEARVAGAPVLRGEGLAMSRGGRRLIEDFSLAIGAGEVIGLSGPSGCGKSSLGDMLLGLLRPDRGTLWRDPTIAKGRYQKIYQDPPAAFSPHVTLRRSLEDVIRLHRLDANAVPPLLDRLHLAPELLDRPPDQVSGGELQRIALLRVLLLEPVFLFADEPTSRLDLITQRDTIKLMVEVVRERNMALLIASHDRDLIDRIADRTVSIGGAA